MQKLTIDDFNRESLAVEVENSLLSQRVIRVLNRIIAQSGKPSTIRTDNGPEFISHQQWCENNGITMQYIHPEGQCRMHAATEKMEA